MSEYHRSLGITLLEAKWLDPECHQGCQSLVLKNKIESLQKEVEALKSLNWTCGCGAKNGINLEKCSVCKRERHESNYYSAIDTAMNGGEVK